MIHKVLITICPSCCNQCRTKINFSQNSTHNTEARYTIIATHSLLAALETGDMEVDDFVTRDDVGDTVAILGYL